MDKKDRSLLIGTLYQPSSNPREKLLWTEKIEAISATLVKFIDGTIILTGDRKIDIKETLR